MEPILVAPMIYVLELEDDCFYVGITYNLNLRIAQHLSGTGAGWTKMHKPVKIVEVFHEGCTRQMEDEVTKRYVDIYGAENVRGGSWCKV
jgi:predicted GIY-YIG superfamily endonuclease